MAMDRGIAQARAYCEAIGKDPDELVDWWHGKARQVMPRHLALIGADASLAENALRLSPRQIELLKAKQA